MVEAPKAYYADKGPDLAELFGSAHVEIWHDSILVDGRRFPVIDDVIILLPADRYPKSVVDSLGGARTSGLKSPGPFANDIQDTFGDEWRAYPELLAEHEKEFSQYFDLIDFDLLRTATVCDLGCGSGRWSYHLRNRCKRLILVDFSDAIFVARRNLRDCDTAIFFMADLTDLPFRRPFADLIICLGVLHHLPIPALYAVRRLRPFAPRILVYLYYALDNRPIYFRPILAMVTGLRRVTSRIHGPRARGALTWILTLAVYSPAILLGRCLHVVGLGRMVPLYETYRGKSLRRIRQDAYDRFFTRIEQRVTSASILRLKDTFASVTVSPNLPYWHFLCESKAPD
jgi:SAM-dependent methyltransferase